LGGEFVPWMYFVSKQERRLRRQALVCVCRICLCVISLLVRLNRNNLARWFSAWRSCAGGPNIGKLTL
jgi:hypothetical protein